MGLCRHAMLDVKSLLAVAACMKVVEWMLKVMVVEQMICCGRMVVFLSK